MARDALEVLWRLRDAAVREASTNLANARAIERAEADRLDAHARHVQREQADAAGAEIADFAVWLPHARRQTELLHGVLRQENARVERCQQVLVACRTEAEAVAKALQRKREAAALVRLQREQAAMDEAAGRTGQS
jgi:flagellar export protein FliJ